MSRAVVAFLLCCCVLAGCVRGTITPTEGEARETPGGPLRPLPHFDHIVVLIEENHGYNEIIGSAQAPYLNALAAQGAVFTNSYAVAHPSQPNYIALFAGSTFGISSDACPQTLPGPNLADALRARSLRFTAYSENLPSPGFTGCNAGSVPGQPNTPLYARKHSPWVDFANVPAASNQPFSSFPTDFSQLPEVAIVVPNQRDNMHSGSVAAGDTWLKQHLGAYVQWAITHNSLLIVTWDEDDRSSANHILTFFVGAHIHAGHYGETINHYDVLRTIEALVGVPYTNDAASALTIVDVWQA